MTGALHYALTLSNTGFLGPLSSAGGALSRFAGGVMRTVAPLAAALAIATSGAGALGLAVKGVSNAAELEKTSRGFQVLVGDVGKADAALSKIKRLAADTPLDFPELADAGSKLASFGLDAEKIPGVLARIGDAAKGNNADIAELARSYGQVLSGGTMQWEDVEKWIDRGVNLLPEFAAELGVGVGEVKKLGAEGKITFPMLERALVAVTSAGGRYHGMMETMARTTLGRIDLLKGSITEVLTAFGQPVNDAIKPVLTDAIARVESLGPMLTNLGSIAGNAIETAYAAATSGVLGELLMAEIHNAGEMALGRAYVAATSGKLGELLAVELQLGGARFLNWLGSGFAKSMQGIGALGNYLATMMDAAGEKLKAALANAGGSFASLFGRLMTNSVANVLENINVLGFDGKGMADDIRKKQAVSMGALAKNTAAAYESANKKAEGFFAAAASKIASVAAGGKVVSDETMAKIGARKDVLDDDLNENSLKRKGELEKLRGIVTDRKEEIRESEKEAPKVPPPPVVKAGGALAQAVAAAPAGGALEAATGADAPASRKIRLHNAADSERRRWDRMSGTDKARHGGSFDAFKAGNASALDAAAGAASPLDAMRSRIPNIHHSTLLEERLGTSGLRPRPEPFPTGPAWDPNGERDPFAPVKGPDPWAPVKGRGVGEALANGERLARGAGATINPNARALGDGRRAAQEKPDNRDLTSVLRKIEEHTAAFAEIAVA